LFSQENHIPFVTFLPYSSALLRLPFIHIWMVDYFMSFGDNFFVYPGDVPSLLNSLSKVTPLFPFCFSGQAPLSFSFHLFFAMLLFLHIPFLFSRPRPFYLHFSIALFFLAGYALLPFTLPLCSLGYDFFLFHTASALCTISYNFLLFMLSLFVAVYS